MSSYETGSSRVQEKHDRIENRKNRKEMSHIDLCSGKQEVYRLYLTMHVCRYGKGRNEITRGTENASGEKEYRHINQERDTKARKRFHYVCSNNTEI